MAFETFPIGSSPPSVELAQARLASQAALVNDVVASMGQAVGARLDAQRTAVNGIAAKIGRTAEARIRGQRAMADEVRTNLYVAAGQRLQNQQATVGQLRAQLLVGAQGGQPAGGGVTPPFTGGGTTVGPGGYCIYDTVAAQYTWVSVEETTTLSPSDVVIGGPYSYTDSHGVDHVIAPAPPDSPCSGPASSTPGCGPTGAGFWARGKAPGDAAVCVVPGKFYCMQPPDLSLAPAVAPSTAVAALLAEVPPFTIVGGPYDTKDEAFAACKPAEIIPPDVPPDGGPGPGGPVCCVDASGPPPGDRAFAPGDPCDILPKLPDAFGSAGSLEWCAHIQDIIDGLTAVGNAVVDFILNVLDLGDVTSTIDAPTWTDFVALTSPFAVGLRLLMKLLDGTSLDVRKWLKCLVAYFRQLADALPGCKGPQMVALAVLRAVIGWGKSWLIGMNFGVQMSATLVINLPAIERVLDYVQSTMCPSEIPGVATAMQCLRQGQIERPQYECWLGAHATKAAVWEPVLIAGAHAVSPQDVILQARIDREDDGEIAKRLTERGWMRKDDRGWLMNLYDRPATFQQWLHWIKADVTDIAHVNMFQLDTGFDEFWASRAGNESYSHGLREQDARHEWRSQFRLPSADQARQWLWQLFPGRPLVVNPFGPVSYDGVIKSENWAPAVEQWLIDSKYRFLTDAEARTGWHRGLMTDPDYRDQIQSRGIRQELEPLVVVTEGQDKRRLLMREVGAWTVQTLVGALTWQAAPADLILAEAIDQGYQPAQLDAALAAGLVQTRIDRARRGATLAQRTVVRLAITGYSAGTVNKNSAQSALTAAGWLPDAVNAVLAAADGQIALALAKQAIGVLKSAYLGGEIPEANLMGLITSAGITAPRASQYAAAWRFERSNTHKMATAGQIARWVQEGLLDVAVARGRLLNLGFRDPDLTLMMSELAQKLAKAEAAMELKAEKAREKEAARLARLAKEAEALAARAAHLAEHTEPIGALKAEYIDGILTEEYVRARLSQYGYADSVIDHYIADWNLKRAATAARSAP